MTEQKLYDEIDEALTELDIRRENNLPFFICWTLVEYPVKSKICKLFQDIFEPYTGYEEAYGYWNDATCIGKNDTINGFQYMKDEFYNVRETALLLLEEFIISEGMLNLI